MWPDRVSNPGSLALESDALPTALRGPAMIYGNYGNKCLERCIICVQQIFSEIEN